MKQIGVGFSTYNEMCGLAPSRILGAIRYAAGGWEAATIRCLPTGTFQVVTGTSPHGQGHETAWSQIVADQLGVRSDEVEVLHGDTSVSPLGIDTYGSRSLPVGGAALCRPARRSSTKAREIVAHQLEVAADDLDYADGTFTVKGTPTRTMTVEEALPGRRWRPTTCRTGWSRGSRRRPPTTRRTSPGRPAPTPRSSRSTPRRATRGILRYVAVDDVGTVVNPLIVDGQVHGGITQGIAAGAVRGGDLRRGRQPADGTLVTYLVPSAAELPSFELDRTETPRPTTRSASRAWGRRGRSRRPPP